MNSTLGSIASSRAGTRISGDRVSVARSARRCPVIKAQAQNNNVNASVAESLTPVQNGKGPNMSQGTLAVHGGEREGRPRVSDALTTPIVQTSTYTFRDTKELIDYQEGNYGSYEYGRFVQPQARTNCCFPVRHALLYAPYPPCNILS